jgi:hypothetical protein
MSKVSETGARNRSNVSRPNDNYAHEYSLFGVGTRCQPTTYLDHGKRRVKTCGLSQSGIDPFDALLCFGRGRAAKKQAPRAFQKTDLADFPGFGSRFPLASVTRQKSLRPDSPLLSANGHAENEQLNQAIILPRWTSV